MSSSITNEPSANPTTTPEVVQAGNTFNNNVDANDDDVKKNLMTNPNFQAVTKATFKTNDYTSAKVQVTTTTSLSNVNTTPTDLKPLANDHSTINDNIVRCSGSLSHEQLISNVQVITTYPHSNDAPMTKTANPDVHMIATNTAIPHANTTIVNTIINVRIQNEKVTGTLTQNSNTDVLNASSSSSGLGTTQSKSIVISSTTTSTTKEDAPGWASSNDFGPICWKCQGTGVKPTKKPKLIGQLPCPVCNGEKRLAKKKVVPTTTIEESSSSKPKKMRTLPEGYIAPGPSFPNVPVEVDPNIEECCALLGNWKIIQSLRGGHRWSTDDLLTAWVACKEAEKLKDGLRYHCDLGCGIGTVLLMTSWYFSSSQNLKGIGIEAQSVSASKARRSIIMNGVENRLQVVNKDFREYVQTRSETILYDLITGTPPYFPITYDQNTNVAKPAYGGMPTFEQSAPARFEFRGGIEAYIETASRLVAKDGMIILCEGNIAAPPKELDRVSSSAQQFGLKLVRTVFVHGREDKPPLFAVHVLVPLSNEQHQRREFVRERFDVRHANGGKRTENYLAMCLEMGIAPFTTSE